jgi:hypothetical protein
MFTAFDSATKPCELWDKIHPSALLDNEEGVKHMLTMWGNLYREQKRRL